MKNHKISKEELKKQLGAEISEPIHLHITLGGFTLTERNKYNIPKPIPCSKEDLAKFFEEKSYE